MYAPDGRFLAEFPASFVRDGGVPTWAFVLDVLSEILQPISGTALTRETTGALMSAEGAVEGGDYILHVDGECLRNSLDCDLDQIILPYHSPGVQNTSAEESLPIRRLASPRDLDPNPGLHPIKFVDHPRHCLLINSE